MKKRRILMAGGALLLSTFAACEPYLSREGALAGKLCVAADSCADGYDCIAGKCEPSGPETVSGQARPGMAGEGGGSAGAGSSDGAAGAGSEPAGSASASSEPPPMLSAGAGGTPGSAGAGPVSTNPGGSGGDDSPLSPPGGADAGCASPVPLYPDLDADGFGTLAGSIQGCPPLDGFVTVDGDCFDERPAPGSVADDVFPDQARFFTEPYPTSAGESFDYDCSGDEDPDPDNDFVPAPTDCEERVGPLGCGSSNGYVTPENPRRGDGVDPLCGTRARVQCIATSATACGLVPINGGPFPCH